MSRRQDRTTNGILELARSVLTELDLDVVLERVLRAAQELTEARYAAVGVLDAERAQLRRFLTRGVDEETRAAIGAPPRGRGVLGALIEEPVPLRLADVAEHPCSYGFPPGHPPMRTFLGVPITIDGRPFGNLYLTEKAGGRPFSEADERALVALADFAGVAIDHARRYAGAREDRDELAQTVAALEATSEISRAVGGETDPEVVLRLIASRGRALVSARVLLIELIRGEELEIAAGAGELPAGLIGRRLPLADTVAAQTIRTQATQRLEDDVNRARFDERGLGRLGLSAAAGLTVPLVYRGRSHGVLLAVDRVSDGPAFSPDDETLLQSFASSAATAVATAESFASERQRQRLAAAEGERQRWARELHDETLQSLSAVRVVLSSARRSGVDDGVLPQAVAQAVVQLDEAIANLRALITDLRPAALDELGVTAAIEGLAERSSRHGIEVDTSVELAPAGVGGGRLPEEVETSLYRIVQEALTNAAKHGRASRAVVEIREHEQLVHLTVRDDGCGFQPDAHTAGFGLLGMRERVLLLGGELEVRSGPGEGTVVTATIPARRSGAGTERVEGPAAASPPA